MSTQENKSTKKILENPVVSSLVVPIAIVLIGALIIFGVTRMLSTEQSYKDLVRELHSKTFGNRWVAAYELSKVISSSSVKEEDKPWLVENLGEIYKDSKDPRSRNFIVTALSALKSNQSIPTLNYALKDNDASVRYSAVAAIGNLELSSGVDFNSLRELLIQNDDLPLKQASALALATHSDKESEAIIEELLTHEVRNLRYTAALCLINFRNNKALPVLDEISKLSSLEKSKNLMPGQIVGMKMNLLVAAKKNNWNVQKLASQIVKNEENNAVLSKARELLNQLKN